MLETATAQEATPSDEALRWSPSGLADEANAALAREPAEYRQALGQRLRERMAVARQAAIERRLEAAEFAAQDFVASVNGIQKRHTDSTDGASRALDRFVSTVLTAVQLASGEEAHPRAGLEDVTHWFTPARSLQNTFELHERGFQAGRMNCEEFMRGHAVLTRDILSKLRERLDLPAPRQPMAWARPHEQMLGRAPAARTANQRASHA